jgi:coenzyme F420-0:L-glutamate ligase/coenzyme F420-1:gamma-L-glutamate ligase
MKVFAVPDLPEFRPGDSIPELVSERVDLRPDDVVCVASTIVSKVEDRVADLSAFPAGPRAREIATNLERATGDEKDPRFAQAVLEESTDLLMEAPFLLTETRFGHVTVNAGIDRSNVPGGDLLLLPRRPSESAGQRGVAIGWAGTPAARDWRGERDRDGRELGVTVQAIVDELAAAANLVAGEGAGGTPVVVVRDFDFGDHEGSDALFRDVEGDFVRQALREWSYDG